jgi:hypothetical protein
MSNFQQAKRGPTSMAPSVPMAGSMEMHQMIAARAYEIFWARGGEHGHDQEDWYQAEREVVLGRQ